MTPTYTLIAIYTILSVLWLNMIQLATSTPLDLGYGGVYDSPEANEYWARRFGSDFVRSKYTRDDVGRIDRFKRPSELVISERSERPDRDSSPNRAYYDTTTCNTDLDCQKGSTCMKIYGGDTSYPEDYGFTNKACRRVEMKKWVVKTEDYLLKTCTYTCNDIGRCPIQEEGHHAR